jgi:hypothetical protein
MRRHLCSRKQSYSQSRWADFSCSALAGAANAADWDRGCDRKIAHQQRELDRAIERHGYWSHQAQNDRRELDRLYARCRNRDGYR